MSLPVPKPPTYPPGASGSTETTLGSATAKLEQIRVLLAGGGGGGGGGPVTQATSPWVTSDANALAKLETIRVLLAAPLSVGLPTGASTEATLALIKAKTDNLDVALSTRTKPGDTQPVSAASLPLPTGASTETTLAALNTKIPASPAAEHTTAASPNSVELSDGAAFYVGAKTGQLPAALDGSGNLKTRLLTLADVVALGAGASAIGTVGVTSLPSIPSGSNTVGKVDQGAAGASAWKVDGSSVTQPVSAGSLPLPSGASTEVTLAGIKTGTDKIPASPALEAGGNLERIATAIGDTGAQAAGPVLALGVVDDGGDLHPMAGDGFGNPNVNVLSLPPGLAQETGGNLAAILAATLAGNSIQSSGAAVTQISTAPLPPNAAQERNGLLEQYLGLLYVEARRHTELLRSLVAATGNPVQSDDELDAAWTASSGNNSTLS